MLLYSTALAEEAAGSAEPSWFDTAFKKLISFPLGGWMTLVLLVGIPLGVWLMMRATRTNRGDRIPSAGIGTFVMAIALERVAGWNPETLSPNFIIFLQLAAALCFGMSIGTLIGDYLYVGNGKKFVWDARALSMGALCLAISVVLSRIRLFAMPSGGSITPASKLPLMLFAFLYGPGPGLLLGLAYGLMDYMFGGWFLNVWQFLLDYPIAFSLLGLAGLTHRMENKRLGLVLGTVIGSLGRYIAVVLAGVAFWAEGRTGAEAWLYSLSYNGVYMAVECVLCVVIAALLGGRLLSAVRAARR